MWSIPRCCDPHSCAGNVPRIQMIGLMSDIKVRKRPELLCRSCRWSAMHGSKGSLGKDIALISGAIGIALCKLKYFEGALICQLHNL